MAKDPDHKQEPCHRILYYKYIPQAQEEPLFWSQGLESEGAVAAAEEAVGLCRRLGDKRRRVLGGLGWDLGGGGMGGLGALGSGVLGF